ncbi:MAG TPA: sigma-54 dependent transcriptional regulator [Pyrinomonadaceae bacterium]|nr:sigma-54 dependent transcriptional regulator [Pyrinomonadaceae bacterium]
MTSSPSEGTFRALVIDDEHYVREFVCDVLRGDGWSVSQSPSAKDAFEWLPETPWSVVFCDVTLGGVDGYNLLHSFKEKLPDSRVVLMSGHGNINGPLDATAFGAYDYFLQRFGTEELQLLSEALRDQLTGRTKRSSPARRTAACHSDIELVGRSQALIAVMKELRRVSTTNVPVLITGESGTGKELVASAIHNRSARADRPFIAINCGAIPTDLIEAELFGCVRGSFAGADRDRHGLWEEADGGTLFLDEVTQTSLSFQATLLRAMQMGEIRRVGSNHTTLVNVRVIAASNRDLEREVAAGRFRSDLFQRLNAESIALPPLRERPEDIPPLAQSFADRLYSLNAPVKFSAEALAVLERYNWPGNIRELETAVVQAVAMCDGTVRVKDLPERVRHHSGADISRTNGSSDQFDHEELAPLSRIEGRYVTKVLEHTRGNKQAAARILGVDRKTLDRMIKRHNIETDSLRARARPTAAASNLMTHR